MELYSLYLVFLAIVEPLILFIILDINSLICINPNVVLEPFRFLISSYNSSLPEIIYFMRRIIHDC
jgi:hypothetical protein